MHIAYTHPDEFVAELRRFAQLFPGPQHPGKVLRLTRAQRRAGAQPLGVVHVVASAVLERDVVHVLDVEIGPKRPHTDELEALERQVTALWTLLTTTAAELGYEVRGGCFVP